MRRPILCGAALWVIGCSGSYDALRPQVTASGAPRNAGASDSVAILIGAGDIARCEHDGDEGTTAIVDSVLRHATAPAWVFALGDNVYERGTAREFRECYDPSWGRFRDVTRPVPGNHEYKNGQLFGIIPLFGNADPYFAYFSSFPGQAGTPGEGWYHYRHGAWDVFALNTPGDRHVKQGGEVWRWLEGELAQLDPAGCSVAYYHYPRFTVGKHGDQEKLRPLWELLDRHGVELFLVGHDHNYQRFHPQNAAGERDAGGVVQFVVGTGGGELRSDSSTTAGELAHWIPEHYGVLKLTLRPASYEWEFITVDGVVGDAGESGCQNGS